MDDAKKRENGDRILTGIDWFDKLTGGGPPAGTVSVIHGHPGSGKTTMARGLELAVQPSLGCPGASIVNIARCIVANADNDVLFFWIDCDEIPGAHVIEIAKGVALQKRAFAIVFAPDISNAGALVADAVFETRYHRRADTFVGVRQMYCRKTCYNAVFSKWVDIPA